jgi:hypothetical protein
MAFTITHPFTTTNDTIANTSFTTNRVVLPPASPNPQYFGVLDSSPDAGRLPPNLVPSYYNTSTIGVEPSPAFTGVVYDTNQQTFSGFNYDHTRQLENENRDLLDKNMILTAKVTDLMTAIKKMKTLPADFFANTTSLLIYVELLTSSVLGIAHEY